MSTSKKIWASIVSTIFLVFFVLASVLVVIHFQRNVPVQDRPAQTHVPHSESTYWDQDKMESASPAPMPSG